MVQAEGMTSREGGSGKNMALEIASITMPKFVESVRRSKIALIPVGSVEAYGPHLPLGTDGLIALALARALGERLSCVVAPLVPVGWTADLDRFPGTLSVPTVVLQSYCRGIAQSLLAAGIRSIVFVNGHAGNIIALEELCGDLMRPPVDAFAASINVWQFIQPLASTLLDSPDNKFGHGGELNTSIMLHTHPHLVNMSAAGSAQPAKPVDPPGVSRPFQFAEIAPSGSIGDATLATETKGRQIFDLAVDEMLQFLLKNIVQ
jgi:creatinine amidohydrolase